MGNNEDSLGRIDSRSHAALVSPYPVGKFANLPVPFKKGKAAKPNLAQLKSKVAQLERNPVTLLHEIDTQLGIYVREPLNPKLRFDIAEIFYNSAYPAFHRAYEIYVGRKRVPGNTTDKGVMMRSASAVIDKLATSYKQAFSGFEKEGVLARSTRKRLLPAGFRVLELIQLNLYFLSCQFKPVPVAEWHNNRRIFFLLFKKDQVDTEYPLVAHMLNYQTKDMIRMELPNPSTARKLFLKTELQGFVNLSSWPQQYQQRPAGYIEAVMPLLDLRGYDGRAIPDGSLAIYEDSAGSAGFRLRKSFKGMAITVDVLPLARRVRDDQEVLEKKQILSDTSTTGLLAPVRDIAAMDRVPVVSMMISAMLPHQRKHVRQPVFGKHKLRIYFGFKEAYKLILDLVGTTSAEYQERRGLSDTFAMQAATYSDAGASASQQAWEVQDISDGGLLASTHDAPSANPKSVGTMVCYSIDDELQKPFVGYISRIGRTLDDRLNLGVAKLAEQVELGLVKDVEHLGESKGVPVFLLTDDRVNWRLVVDPEYGYIKGTPLMLITRSRPPSPVRLGRSLHEESGFVVYELSAPKL